MKLSMKTCRFNKALLLLPSLILLGCPGATQISEPPACDDFQQPQEQWIDQLWDRDGDGFWDLRDGTCPDHYQGRGDCDDEHESINPGATEICDGVDNNCDGAIDEGLAMDADMDGDAAPGSCVEGQLVSAGDCDDENRLRSHLLDEEICNGIDDDCEPATLDSADLDEDGFTDCLDCDDVDPTIHPAANEELCDGIDNDCEPETPDSIDLDTDGSGGCDDCDDNDPLVSPFETESLCNGLDDDCDPITPDSVDLDGDGISDCTDCDDNRPDIYPGAFEDCDGIDNDCDGLIDEGIDADGDGSAHPADGCGDDCDDSLATVYPGAPEICGDAIDQDCNGEDRSCPEFLELADCSVKIVGASGAAGLGNSFAVGDVTGDGIADLLIGAAEYDRSDSLDDDAGGVWILPGPLPEDGVIDLDSDRLASMSVGLYRGALAGDRAGESLAFLGDIDGDGNGDFIVGAPGFDRLGDRDHGAVYIVRGGPDLPLGLVELANVGHAVEGNTPDSEFGSAVAAVGDMDGHGRPEFLVGAPRAGSSARGWSYLVRGEDLVFDLLEAQEAVDIAQRLKGPHRRALSGTSVASAGDLDGDGLPDLIVGFPAEEDEAFAGGAAVLFGESDFPEPMTHDLNDAPLLIEDELEGARFGAAVATAGTILGPWFSTILVSSPGYDGPAGSSEGAVYLFEGGVGTGGLSIDRVDERQTLMAPSLDAVTMLRGGRSGVRLGESIAHAGDVNGDGYDDFLIGAPGDDAGRLGAGAVHLIFGPLAEGDYSLEEIGSLKLLGENPGDDVGRRLTRGGDLTGDGLDDLLIGSPGFDLPGRPNAGALYVCKAFDF